jgi:hypothetical protein
MTRRCAVVAAAACLVIVATACSSDHSARSANSSVAASTIASTEAPASTPEPSSSRTTPTSSDPRLAVQQAWTNFWSVTVSMYALPPGSATRVISSVAVDPVLQQMKSEIVLFNETHIARYGYSVSHPYGTTVTGNQAVIKDCMDQSHAGSLFTTSGAKRSVGQARDNTTAALVKGADGVWRVKNIVYLLDVKC